ncbi:spore cortex biosynthesis protein YabQ [Oceanobacillus massiliensis]|uniref:spore cortex biosynthesis protein YabQ n=1 Tax=Oceanobacillus massiliensis TaxID=1465765 RepID=UPI00301961A6
MTLGIQFLTMIAMVLSGIYLGIVQETFRRFTRYWKKRILLTYFLECCFWLTQTAIIYYVLFRVNAGEVRLYVLLACFLGFSVYQVLVRSVYKKLLERLIRIGAAIYRFFSRLVHMLIISPISWCIRFIIRLIMSIIMLLTTIILFILKVLFAPFRWILIGIYRLLPNRIKNFLNKIAGFYSTMKNICYKWVKYLKFKRR